METQPIKFRFTGIQLLSKEMRSLVAEPLTAEMFNYNIRVETRVQAKTKSVLIFVFVNISDNKENYLAKIEAVCVFEIEKFDEVLKLNENNLYDVPGELNDTIRPVSISTVRGIVYSEFRGTPLHNAIMPVVYLKDFVEQTIEKRS